MRVAIATFHGVPPGFPDDVLLLEALSQRGASATRISWEEPGADFGGGGGGGGAM